MSTGHSPGMTHRCYGASDCGDSSHGCQVGWICTIEDGFCEGASRCGDCQREQMLQQEQRRREREMAEWEE